MGVRELHGGASGDVQAERGCRSVHRVLLRVQRGEEDPIDVHLRIPQTLALRWDVSPKLQFVQGRFRWEGRRQRYSDRQIIDA